MAVARSTVTLTMDTAEARNLKMWLWAQYNHIQSVQYATKSDEAEKIKAMIDALSEAI